MSLLREIQDAATNENTSLPTVLRKCRILATRLKHEGLKEWTQFELDGYPFLKTLPDYRATFCQAFGTFFGVGGQRLKNAPIGISSIPKVARTTLLGIKFGHGIASLENMVKGANKDVLERRWPADTYKKFGNSIYPNMELMEAWNVIPVSFIVGILDTVRNRVLNFALEIEEQYPDAGNVLSISTPMSSKIQHIFNTTINGSVGNFATGSENFNQSAIMEISQGDFEGLSKFLKSLGLSNRDVKELHTAIKSDEKPKQKRVGGKVAEWLGQAVTKSAQGLLKIGSGVASKVLTDAIFRFYGFPTS